jgi:GNAT superfamily N-acetyltransferase
MIMSGGEIQALFIDPDAHRRGAGRLLVEHAIKLCDTVNRRE